MGHDFDWDEEKAITNLRKHKIRFEEAQTVFNDPLAITIPDPDHSEVELRLIDLGASSNGRLLVVGYTQRGPKIRIITARKATAAERRNYEQGYS